MEKDAATLVELWNAVNLIDDWLSGGFTRDHGGLQIEEEKTPILAREAASAEADQRADAERAAQIALIAGEVAGCTKCALSLNRTRTVPGEGAPDPLVLLVGEGPGEEEDKTGRPFVGRAGQYLDTWLKPLGLDRKKCFVANCVKCRPPQNREPRPEEISSCAPYLERQIEALKPRVILCLGRIASQHLLSTTASLAALRGRVHSRNAIPLVVTYHPSAVLRDETLRRPVWEDLKLLKTLL